MYRLTARRPSLAFLAALLIAIVNFGAWALVYWPVSAPDVPARVAGVSYAPFQRNDNPARSRSPDPADIARDLSQLAALTSGIRTYTSAQSPELPAIAAANGLALTAGIWLTGNEIEDTSEIEAGTRAALASKNVTRLIVGNETVLRKVFTPEQLAARIKRVRSLVRVTVPVSTAEPWNVWLDNPRLVEQVDFITLHLLPYWEGIDQFNAVGHALFQVDAVKRRFPNIPILIGEVGWPSNGDTIGSARASPSNQARFIREFLVAAAARQLDYFLMEANDQPWKVQDEGNAGAYWGIADAHRQAKFAFSGPVEIDPFWRTKAVASSVLGFLLIWFSLTRLGSMRPLARVSFAVAAQLIVVGAVTLATAPFAAYLRATDWIAIAIFVPTLLMMVLILLAHAFEFAELFWEGSLRRSFAPRLLKHGEREPSVSIHVACCNEPPDMVIATIKSLAQLRYDNFEVLVIDNNTSDEATWQPVADFVATLPPNFKFFHLAACEGFKAGALNFALAQSDSSAEIIAVVDSDYQVDPLWLSSVVGFFEDKNVGVVQTPQAHRGWGGHLFRTMMNWEYDGFFRIGMHHRNERNAIVQHGTMTMISARALRAHGAWSEWCVCEDTELGLRLMQQGLSTVYVDQVFGRGLTPDGFAAYKKQRYRWAQGGMQILKAHGKSLLKLGTLSGGQRYHFLAGWLPWMGDALHLLFALAAIIWTVGAVLMPTVVTLPTLLFMLPLVTFVMAKLVVGPLLYWRRVPCSIGEIVGASVAGMAVSHGIARGVIAGLFGRNARFEVTHKGAGSGTGTMTVSRAPIRDAIGAVREEALMLVLLVAAACLLLVSAPAASATPIGFSSAGNRWLWIAMLALQALPYAAALACMRLSMRPDAHPVTLNSAVSRA